MFERGDMLKVIYGRTMHFLVLDAADDRYSVFSLERGIFGAYNHSTLESICMKVG